LDRDDCLGDRALRTLPLLTLYLTERCNSRCVSCDFWRHGRADISIDSVRALLPDLARLQTREILISGGEPLVHPQWAAIAQLLRSTGRQLWLLTSGLALGKHAARAAALFQAITVSLDGTDAAMYAAIRGLDGFDAVCDGIRAVADRGMRVGVRVTVQRGNFRNLGGFVDLARQCGAAQISFLAADVRNPHAFGRIGPAGESIALSVPELTEFATALEALEREHAQHFRSGFIAESPAKLRRLLQYYAALRGIADFPPTHCNAPEFSAVIEAGGRINPCFFIQGPTRSEGADGFRQSPDGIEQALNEQPMRALRAAIRAGARPECAGCVCSMWRDPAFFGARPLIPAPHPASAASGAAPAQSGNP
jgi:MoaA/NifB/PqqE/SkfB family radical SAM enzyme